MKGDNERRGRIRGWWAIVGAWLIHAGIAHAGAAFTGLGVPEGENSVSAAAQVSADGAVVVGWVERHVEERDEEIEQGFRWAAGEQTLLALPEHARSHQAVVAIRSVAVSPQALPWKDRTPLLRINPRCAMTPLVFCGHSFSRRRSLSVATPRLFNGLLMQLHAHFATWLSVMSILRPTVPLRGPPVPCRLIDADFNLGSMPSSPVSDFFTCLATLGSAPPTLNISPANEIMVRCINRGVRYSVWSVVTISDDQGNSTTLRQYIVGGDCDEDTWCNCGCP